MGWGQWPNCLCSLLSPFFCSVLPPFTKSIASKTCRTSPPASPCTPGSCCSFRMGCPEAVEYSGAFLPNASISSSLKLMLIPAAFIALFEMSRGMSEEMISRETVTLVPWMLPGIMYRPSDLSWPLLPKLNIFSDGSGPITLALSTSSKSSIYMSSHALPATLELQHESRAAAPLASHVNILISPLIRTMCSVPPTTPTCRATSPASHWLAKWCWDWHLKHVRTFPSGPILFNSFPFLSFFLSPQSCSFFLLGASFLNFWSPIIKHPSSPGTGTASTLMRPPVPFFAPGPPPKISTI